MFCYNSLGLFALRKATLNVSLGPIHEGPCYTFSHSGKDIYASQWYPFDTPNKRVMLTLLQNPKKHYILEYFFRIETMYDVFTLWVNINQNAQLQYGEKILVLNCTILAWTQVKMWFILWHTVSHQIQKTISDSLEHHHNEMLLN